MQLPNFDEVEPETWFAVAYANFALQKVTDTTTKYYYILSKLDASTLRKLSAFLKQPRESDPYREIREILCDAYEPPLEQKLDALLALADIGDTRPKEFGLELQRLASDASVDDFLKRIFIRCRPQQIMTAITGSLSGKLEAVVAAADRAWTAAAAAPATPLLVSAVSGQASRQGGRRGGHQQGNRSTGGQTTTITLCTFHRKFGDSARKCTPGCSWWNEDRSPAAACSRWKRPSTARMPTWVWPRKTSKSVAEHGQNQETDNNNLTRPARPHRGRDDVVCWIPGPRSPSGHPPHQPRPFSNLVCD